MIEAVSFDVTHLQSVELLRDSVATRFGALDVLVNDAVILYDTWQQARSADLAVVHQALDSNLVDAWRVATAFMPLLRRSIHGRIVNVSSKAGSLAGMSGGISAYSVSKAAFNALNRMLADELRYDRVVNSVCPGWVATDMGGAGGQPVTEGAASVVWAALLPNDGSIGGFFRDGRPLPWREVPAMHGVEALLLGSAKVATHLNKNYLQ